MDDTTLPLIVRYKYKSSLVIGVASIGGLDKTSSSLQKPVDTALSIRNHEGLEGS